MDTITREAVTKLAASRGERVTRCPSCNELFIGTAGDKDSEYATHQHAATESMQRVAQIASEMPAIAERAAEQYKGWKA